MRRKGIEQESGSFGRDSSDKWPLNEREENLPESANERRVEPQGIENMLARLDEVGGLVRKLTQLCVTKADVDEAKSEVMEALSSKRSEYEDLKKRSLDELIMLFDSIRQKFKWLWDRFQELSSISIEEKAEYSRMLCGNFSPLLKEVTEFMKQRDVYAFNNKGHFDRKKQVAVNVKITNRKEHDGKVAGSLRCGFIQKRDGNEKILRPQMVNVYRYQSRGQAEDREVGQNGDDSRY